MAYIIKRLHANLFSVLAKERELVIQGYQENKIQDEQKLRRGEYAVRAPNSGSPEVLQGWENISIFWRTS